MESLLTFHSRIRFNPDRNSFIWLHAFTRCVCVFYMFVVQASVWISSIVRYVTKPYKWSLNEASSWHGGRSILLFSVLLRLMLLWFFFVLLHCDTEHCSLYAANNSSVLSASNDKGVSHCLFYLVFVLETP